jgi:hypothetical protein
MENSKALLNHQVESFEIEENGSILSKPLSKNANETSHISASIVNMSVDFCNDSPTQDNYLAGVLLMIVTILMWSIMHITSKIMYNHSELITPFDVVLPMGFVLPTTYFLYSKMIGVNLNLFSFPKSLRYLLISRVLIGMTNNICLFTGLKFISIGKGILIFSTAPLFCSLAAGIFLKEQICIK